MTNELVLALDIGTTSAKAVLFELDGKLIVEAERMITTHYPEQGWAEQDVIEIELSSIGAIRDVVDKAKIKGDEPIALGISCAMHSLICVDQNGLPLSQALIWADGRSIEQVKRLKTTNGNEVYARTGLPNHPMSPLSKLLWMKETNFNPYKQATYFMSVKEYILNRWFGCRVIDYSMAAATGLFNMKTYDWDEEILLLCGVERNQLSKIVPPTEILTGLDSKVAQGMGISNQIPFVIGAADGQLANLGSGATSPGEVAISAGTSGAIRQMITGSQVSENQETFCYAFTKNRSIIGGPTNNGGIVLQWIKDLLKFKGTIDELINEAEQIDPGSEGLIFLPYINGERAPVWNQGAKGNFFGLTVEHKQEHIIRAVLEGITFNLYHIGTILEQQAGPSGKIYVNGGLARSSIWVQMLADVFGKDIYLSESHHSAAWGAAWTALVAIGKANSFDEIKENILIDSIIKPDISRHEIYSKTFKKYKELSLDMVKHF